MFNRTCTTFDFHHVEQTVTKKLESVIEGWEGVWLALCVILDQNNVFLRSCFFDQYCSCFCILVQKNKQTAK